ncbi:MAG TPA: hypothetical protein VHE81_12620, partial [Lacipirellulaceae bacterium]|nr:hypothetical protein [Lacipirellulaceae bacterium]
MSAVELSGFPLGMESGLANHQCSERYGADDCCGKGSLQEAYKTNFHDGAMKNPDGSQKKIRALSIFDAQFLTTLSYMTIAL